MLFYSFVRFQRWSQILRPTSRSGEMCVRWAARALCAGERRSASGSLARRGLQHIGACQSTALYAVDAVREARGASEWRADGAGRARAAHAHHVAPSHTVRSKAPAAADGPLKRHRKNDFSAARTSIKKPTDQNDRNFKAHNLVGAIGHARL